jgi:DNA-binding MarR family transcriptional regulator
MGHLPIGKLECDDPHESIPFFLNFAADSVRAFVNARLRPLEITWKQLFVLMSCAERSGGLCVSDIQGALSVDPGATTRLVSRLVRNGWIKKENSPGDKRKVHLVVTTLGTTKIKAARKVRANAIQDAISILNASERTQIKTLLEKLIKHVSLEKI